ncbi:MAG: hypothetical protein OEU32_16590, partial [Acidimicrobiia bacterium]|nr:hypothetical protein [Acidimicrobiia bacterium]
FAVLLGFLAPMPASAQDVADVVADVDLRRYYVEPGAEGDINRLEEITASSAAEGRPTGIVILLEEAEQGDDALATMVVEQVTSVDTVVVLWGDRPGERGLGVRSVEYSDAEIAAAADAAVEESGRGGTLEDVAEVFIEALPAAASATGGDTPAASPATATSDDGGGGGFSIWWILIPAVLVIGAIFLFRQSRRNTSRDEGDVDVARAEIRDQLTVVANEILENEDRVTLSGNEEAIQYYRDASQTYKAVGDVLDSTTNLLELAELNDRIDRARWQMDAAEALVEGRAVPPEPAPDKPAACFFDPTHKPGTVEAVVRTPAGDKQVSVCPSCAEKLERGERPEPRMIDVGGRRVPAAKAPRSHGGGGMGGLDMFDVVLGGLGGLGGMLGGGRAGGGSDRDRRPVSLDWGGALGSGRNNRRNTGVFGPDRLPPGRSGSSRRRSSSGSRSRSSKGRARRSM